MLKTKEYRSYTLRNFNSIPQLASAPRHLKTDIEVVGNILPFKANNYVIDELIDWSRVPNDPIYTLVFPRRKLLSDTHYKIVSEILKNKIDRAEAKEIFTKIRYDLNPHPAGQRYNIPKLKGKLLPGIQHKYENTVLFFPIQGQTCHAYCTFCFRWPQFVGLKGQKFAMKKADILVNYLRFHKEVDNVLITGGDPMIMNSDLLSLYVEALVNARLPNLKSIRIGTKSLSYWPYKYVTDKDAVKVLSLFRKVKNAGIHLAFMAHFNHPRELSTPIVKEAIKRIRETGAIIRTQGPLLKHINDDPIIWQDMWTTQVKMGIVPYYMFVVRDTGAKDFFSVPLLRTHEIFHRAYRKVSGLARTVRGPSMSADPGKIEILGSNRVNGEKVITLTMIQGRNKEWVGKPFFAKYNSTATWLNELEPAFGARYFFYEKELRSIYKR